MADAVGKRGARTHHRLSRRQFEKGDAQTFLNAGEPCHIGGAGLDGARRVEAMNEQALGPIIDGDDPA